MSITSVQFAASIIFAFAILHTFLVSKFLALALKFKEGSVGENVFHLLGEVEIVFGFWSAIFLVCYAFLDSSQNAIQYVESLSFSEASFVFVIMTMASSGPVMSFVRRLVIRVAELLPMGNSYSYLITLLVLGPLLGSLVTEPAAMTVSALLLKEFYFEQKLSQKLRYLCLGVLFVNVSIGSVLTHFAAPPVVMVANLWHWNTPFMFRVFGIKAIAAVCINTFLLTAVCRREIGKLEISVITGAVKTPFWITAIHLLFMIAAVLLAHHTQLLLGVFLFFLGFVQVTQEFQSKILLRQCLLVGFFLCGLVVLGGQQSWWLSFLLVRMSDLGVFIGATVLTAFTDNAALTFLASQVSGLSDSFKYYLVAGAVTGGGLTVIANAPNPAGFSILGPTFKNKTISSKGLFLGAVIPTLVALICFAL